MTDAPAPSDTPASTDAGPSPVEALVRACSFLHLCQFTTFPEGLAGNAPACVQRVVQARLGGASPTTPEQRQVIDRLLSCGASSSTCEAFRACMHLGTLRTCAGPMDRRCEGNAAVRCRHSTDAYPTVLACDQLGMTCMNGLCVPPMTAPACDGSMSPRCDGSAVVSCIGGREASEDCSAQGGTCLAGSPARCVPAGTTPCATPGSSCQGNVLTGCRPDPDTGMMHTVRYDCASVGRTCGSVGGSPGLSCVVATECADPPAQWGGTCDGGSVSVCIEGRRVRLPCAAVGRASCSMQPSVASCQS